MPYYYGEYREKELRANRRDDTLAPVIGGDDTVAPVHVVGGDDTVAPAEYTTYDAP